ncbi:hypothetical protein BGZ83_005009, partial [Gryganskiella cystojenkinii]
LNPNWKRQKSATAVLAYGLATFNTRRGPASKAAVIQKKAVKAFRSLGQLAVGIHEYFSSQKCPRRHCNHFLEKHDSRSMYCPGCNRYFDRDAVGSENIGYICEEFIAGRDRPAKFKPAVAGPSAAPDSYPLP